MNRFHPLAHALICGFLLCSLPTHADERIEFRSYTETETYFDEIGYTIERWQAGVREIPRVYVTNVPSRWRDKVSREISVRAKKRLFFRALAPLVLRANEILAEERASLVELARRLEAGEAIEGEDLEALRALAAEYKVSPDSTDAIVEELLRRVDAVPVSLVLSQAAEESGWGTSRFADQGNSLFGQWSWDDKAIKPKEQRAGKGNYGIAAFETPMGSVLAYMQNLNTHPAYASFREERQRHRGTGEPLDGWELAKTLTSYSERGEAYVESLHAIMRVNALRAADEAYLAEGPDTFLVPVGEGAD